MKNKLTSIIRTLLGMEMLEYENKNLLSGDNEVRARKRMELLAESLGISMEEDSRKSERAVMCEPECVAKYDSNRLSDMVRKLEDNFDLDCNGKTSIYKILLELTEGIKAEDIEQQLEDGESLYDFLCVRIDRMKFPRKK